jgi:hypothetical protein
MLLNVLSRRSDGRRAMQALIRDSHETEHAKKGTLQARLAALPRPGRPPGIVEVVPEDGRGLEGPASTSSLQEDFSMNQALSLYLLETIPLLDPDSEDPRPRPAHARREHPRGPGADPAQAARQG